MFSSSDAACGIDSYNSSDDNPGEPSYFDVTYSERATLPVIVKWKSTINGTVNYTLAKQFRVNSNIDKKSKVASHLLDHFLKFFVYLY